MNATFLNFRKSAPQDGKNVQNFQICFNFDFCVLKVSVGFTCLFIKIKSKTRYNKICKLEKTVSRVNATFL